MLAECHGSAQILEADRAATCFGRKDMACRLGRVQIACHRPPADFRSIDLKIVSTRSNNNLRVRETCRRNERQPELNRGVVTMMSVHDHLGLCIHADRLRPDSDPRDAVHQFGDPVGVDLFVFQEMGNVEQRDCSHGYPH
jgi:hypothetical protein